MKNKFLTIIISLISLGLLATKCAEEPFNFIIKNKSNKDIVFTNSKKIDSVKSRMIEDHDYGVVGFVGRESERTLVIIPSDLHFCLSKDKNYYVFYSFKLKSYKDGNFIFDEKYDSIYISKEKLNKNEDDNNYFIYKNNKLIFLDKN